MGNTNVYSRRLQTWEQEFESDTTRPNWGDRLIVWYECLSAKLLPKGVFTHFYFYFKYYIPLDYNNSTIILFLYK